MAYFHKIHPNWAVYQEIPPAMDYNGNPLTRDDGGHLLFHLCKPINDPEDWNDHMVCTMICIAPDPAPLVPGCIECFTPVPREILFLLELLPYPHIYY